MLSQAATAEQLREARKRIAALERELHALRTSVHPRQIHSAHTFASAPVPAQPHASSPKKPNRTIIKPRPLIMTRRAAAAAAAAAALRPVSPIHTSDVSKSASNQPPCPQPDAEQPPQPDSPAEYSDVSRDPSEHSSSHPQEPSAHHDAHQQSSPCMDGKTASSIQVVPSTNTVIPTLEAPQPKNKIPQDNSKPAAQVLASPTVSRAATPVTVASGKTASPSVGSEAKQTVASAPRRRPPPLPVAKTASTKKERVHLVAKCTEPKPGQTRYWTDEEHERFLEAVAEYGEKAYVAISNYVETRTPKQVRTHAQKFQMKMARMARQSIEAGQPIQMPAGMRPVVELPLGSKSTIVTMTPDQTIKLASKSSQGISEIDPSIVCALSASQTQPPPSRMKESKERPNPADPKQPQDASVKVSSNVSDESSSALTDPYLNYIGAAGEAKEEIELENTFAAKLTQTLQGAQSDSESNKGDFLMSDGSSDDAASSGKDDADLEDLENLEDGDLSLAPFANPSENWLLPDNAITPNE